MKATLLKRVPFSRPNVSDQARQYVGQVLDGQHLAGDGSFTQRCTVELENRLAGHCLIVHSGTAALEMAVMLADIGPGDEVILPSFTFSSTANAVALRGGVPVFVDVRADTMNLDETLIEDAITARTKAILPVHYAGICAEMDTINYIAGSYDLYVIEDAAQAYMSTYKGRQAGTMSDASAFSFHETKNVISGEGGAIRVSSRFDFERSEIIREKGTNRKQFLQGFVDKYTWTDIGSSYLPGELSSALLLSDLQRAVEILNYRVRCYERYYDGFEDIARTGRIRTPFIPEDCTTNGHMFYMILRDGDDRAAFIDATNGRGIATPFHYIPLHSAPAGRKCGRVHGSMDVTDRQSSALVRMPMYLGVEEHLDEIIEVSRTYLEATV